MVIKMYGQEIMTDEKEKELVNILIDSSLYLEMPLVDRKNLLNFIMATYCQPCDLTHSEIRQTSEAEHCC